MGFFDKKKGTTITQEAMITPEQQAALSALMQFSQTGKMGVYQAGEAYDGSLGDFNMTQTEELGQNKLADLVKSSMPEIFNMGQDEIKKLLTTDKFDPYAKGGVYEGFSQASDRATQDASVQLSRNLAATGDLYSTANAKESGLLQERGVQNKQNKLAELYQNFSNQKLQGATTAANMGVQEENIAQSRIGLSQSLGSLGRLLQDAQAKAKYADYLRGRTELSATVDAAKTVLNKDIPYGVKSFTTPDSPSPFSQVLNAGLQIAGQAAGAYLTGGFSMLGTAAGASAAGGAMASAAGGSGGGGLFSFFA